MGSKTIASMGLILGLCLCTSAAWGTDYSQVSTRDMAQMRKEMHNSSEQEGKQFRQEWQKRMREMPAEDRAQYRQDYTSSARNNVDQGTGSGDGNGKQKRKRKGSSSDGGSGGGYGSGSGGGSGYGGGGGGGHR